MGEEDALGAPGRAGCIDYVGGGFRKGGALQRLRALQVQVAIGPVDVQDRPVRDAWREAGLADERRQSGIGSDSGSMFRRRPRVQGNVSPTRLEDREQGGQGFRGALEQEPHPALRNPHPSGAGAGRGGSPACPTRSATSRSRERSRAAPTRLSGPQPRARRWRARRFARAPSLA
jgi:hypothetical protein